MKKKRWALLSVGAVWLAFVCAGTWIMLDHSTRPGPVANAPLRWPVESRLLPKPGMPILIMTAHPHCSCSRSSVGELAMLMALEQHRLTAYVVFVMPIGTTQEWEKTDLWRTAAAIPGVTAVIDYGGKEAGLFHALVSGQTLLYDGAGNLVFSGGITFARAHSGDNDGRSAIQSFLATGNAARRETPVFGCALHDPTAKTL